VILTTGFAARAILEHASSRSGLERTLLEVIACATPVMALVAVQTWYHRVSDKARSLALALPFCFVLVAALEWLRRFPEESVRIPSSLLLLSYPVAIGCAIALVLMYGRSGRVQSTVNGLAVALALLPVGGLLHRGIDRPPASNGDGQSRRVSKIVLITVDTLRADAVRSELTPEIDEFSREAVVFTKAISPAPWTLPAISSLMTGLNPAVHGRTHPRSTMSPRFVTLAEKLQEAGYLTGSIGRNTFLLPERNLDQGFLHYEFYPRSNVMKSLGAALLRRIWPTEFRLDVSDAEITERALDWISDHRTSDFFLWVHYFGPHQPYLPPDPFRPRGVPPAGVQNGFDRFRAVRQGTFSPDAEQRAWIKELYHAEVRSADQNVGALLEGLRELKLYEGSLILFTSDHGEEFWEHDGFEHGHTLYRELLEVPLIIKAPGSRVRNEVKNVVSTEQIMSTVLEDCGIEYDRRYLAPALFLRSDQQEQQELVVSGGPLYFEERVAARFGSYWYIRSLVSGREELYNMESDPDQQSSIAESAPDEVQRARSMLVKWHEGIEPIKRVYQTEETEEIQLSPGTRDRLRSLGYIQ
jgi:arylsulfatase A-like enzyme